MTTTYIRVKDLLEFIQNFHKQLSDYFSELSEEADKKRVKVLLSYMSRHEKNFEKATAEYNEKTKQRLMDTWMQYAPDYGMLDIEQVKRIDSDMSVDDVVDTALKLDEQLVKFYEKAERLVDYKVVKNLFAKLKVQEEADKAETVKVAQSIS